MFRTIFLVFCQGRLYREPERTAVTEKVVRGLDMSRQGGTTSEGLLTEPTLGGVYKPDKVVLLVDVVLQLRVPVKTFSTVFTFKEVRGPQMF